MEDGESCVEGQQMTRRVFALPVRPVRKHRRHGIVAQSRRQMESAGSGGLFLVPSLHHWPSISSLSPLTSLSIHCWHCIAPHQHGLHVHLRFPTLEHVGVCSHPICCRLSLAENNNTTLLGRPGSTLSMAHGQPQGHEGHGASLASLHLHLWPRLGLWTGLDVSEHGSPASFGPAGPRTVER